MMKAAIWYDLHDVRIEDIPMPVPGDTDVVIKNEVAGVCGTDVAGYTVNGLAVGYTPGCTMGHELVGTVYQTGSRVPSDIKAGDRVFIEPCHAHRAGLAETDTLGAFSEYILVEDAKVGYNIFKIPDGISFEEAVVGEPFSVSVRAVKKGQAKAEDKAVIFGAGAIGTGIFAALQSKGLKNTVMIDVSDYRLEILKKMGAATFNPRTGDVKEFLIKHFGAINHFLGYQVPDVDVYFDAAAANGLLGSILDMTKSGARIVVVGCYYQPQSLNALLIMENEPVITGSISYSPEDITEALNILFNRSSKVNDMVTHRFKLDQINEAITLASQRDKSLKVLVMP